MKRTLPGQLDLPQTPEVAAKPKGRALPEQAPCDIGLFSDDAKQIDMIDILEPKQ